MKDQLFIFDTTLRDGEQSFWGVYDRRRKIRIARVLEKLKVDIIEAGFPAASEGDFEAVKMVAAEIKDSRICGLARANPGDVARAGEAVKGANAPRIHTFIATSPIHMKAKLRMEPDDVLEKAVEAVKQARNIVDDVEFFPPRMRAGLTRIFCAVCLKPSLKQGRERSMFRTPWDIRCPINLAHCLSG